MKYQICRIQECERRVQGREYGLCSKHYKQVWRHGKTLPTIYDSRKAIVREKDALIPIGVSAKDGYAIVDKEFAWLDRYKWSLHGGYPKTSSEGGSARGMHRLVLGDKQGFDIDHINRNKLDNRTKNLRHCTHHENTLNTVRKKGSCGYKGVTYSKKAKKFIAQIMFKGKNHYLGLFINKKEAAMAYDRKAKELHGSFAALNFGGQTNGF